MNFGGGSLSLATGHKQVIDETYYETVGKNVNQACRDYLSVDYSINDNDYVDKKSHTKSIMTKRSLTTLESETKHVHMDDNMSKTSVYDDTKQIFRTFKTRRLADPIEFPYIVEQQLKSYTEDPYINKIDPKFWSILSGSERHDIERLVKKRMNKRMNKKYKELQNAIKDQEQKDALTKLNIENARLTNKSEASIQRLTLSTKKYLNTSPTKLPSIERHSNLSNQIKSLSSSPLSVDNVVTQEVKQNDQPLSRMDFLPPLIKETRNETPKSDAPVETNEEIDIDSFDGIDRPGLFSHVAAVSPLSTPTYADDISEHSVEFRNEIHIFMSSFFTDSEVERAAILVKAVPELREYFASYGLELCYHDIHLGTDAVSDSHNIEEICMATLDNSLNGMNSWLDGGIMFMAFTGTKFTQIELPKYIKSDDFDSLLATAKYEYDKNKKVLKFVKKQLSKLKLVENKIDENEENYETLDQTQHPGTDILTQVQSLASFIDSNTEEPKSRSRSRSMFTSDKDIDKLQSVFQLTEKHDAQTDIQTNKNNASKQIQNTLDTVDPFILSQWYDLDRSITPSLYVLKPVSSVFPDIINIRDYTKKRAAYNQWIQAKKSMIKILEKHAKNFNLSINTVPSITEKEIEVFMIEAKSKLIDTNPTPNILLIDRTICEYDIQESKTDPIMHNYFDLKQPLDTIEVDNDALQRINRVKEKILNEYQRKVLLEYIVNWTERNGVSPSTNREHLIYIERMCKQLKEQVIKSWQPTLNKLNSDKEERKSDVEVDFDTEINQHRLMISKSCSDYLGSKDLIMKIKTYVNSTSSVPLILLGDSGSGKTSLINESIKHIKSSGANNNLITVMRCCGKTETSTNIRLFLRNLSQELDLIYASKSVKKLKILNNVSHDLKTLKNTFQYRLSRATSSQPLLVVFDGIENFKADYDDGMIDWIPKKLPPHVHMIISFSTIGLRGETMSAKLKKLFGNENIIKTESFMYTKHENGKINCEENLIKRYIENVVRTKTTHYDDRHDFNLSDHLIRTFVNFFKELAYRSVSTLPPLYCRLFIKYAENVMTYKTFVQLSLEPYNITSELYTAVNMKTLLDRIFAHLEKKHGDVFVKRAVGYIAAYQYCGGVTQNELLDLLSLDEGLISALHFGQYGYKCVPESYWVSLKLSLLEYDCLQEKYNRGGYRCISFKNSIFYEVANDRYLQKRDKAVSYHKVIVNYYLNTHKSKTYIQAVKQPIKMKSALDQFPKLSNKRRLNLIAYHLANSNPTVSQLKTEIFFNFVYLRNKLFYSNFESLADDFDMILSTSADFTSGLQADVEVKLIVEFFNLSKNALKISYTQLCSQLVSRFMTLFDKKSSSKPDAPKHNEIKYDFIKDLIKECKKYTECVGDEYYPAILPNLSMSVQPNDYFEEIKGHSETIVDFATNHDGTKLITADINGTFNIWNLKPFVFLKTIYEITDIPRQIRLGFGNAYLIVVTVQNDVNIWNIRKGTKLFTIRPYENEITQITTAGGNENKYLICCFGCKQIAIWNLSTFTIVKSIELVIESEVESNQHSSTTIAPKILLTRSCYAERFGYALKGRNVATIVDSKKGSEVFQLKVKEESGYIDLLDLAGEYCVLLCKLFKNRESNAYNIELHEMKSGRLARIIPGCHDDCIVDASLNQAGSHLVALCYSGKTQTSEITFWNLETEEHRHAFLKQTNTNAIPNRIVATDLRCVVTGSVGSTSFWTVDGNAEEKCYLNMTNVTSKFGQPGNMFVNMITEGVEELIPCSNDASNYVLTRHNENRKLCLWDLNPNKTPLAPPVPTLIYETGRIMPDSKLHLRLTDIVLAYDDDKIAVLTDKGSSDNGDTTSQQSSYPIFQSIEVFNLHEKKYEYKVHQLFICAFDSNEYLILRNDDAHLSEHTLLLLGLSETRGHFIIYSMITGHVYKRMRPVLKKVLIKEAKEASNRAPKFDSETTNIGIEAFLKSEHSKRRETLHHAHHHQPTEAEELEKQSKNIEQFMVSGNQKYIIASFYSNVLNLFDLTTLTHIQTLEDPNSLLLLHVAYFSNDGKYLIHPTYDSTTKCGYITVWDCKAGKVKRRLKNETNVVGVTMSDDTKMVVFCKQNGTIKYWRTDLHGSLKVIRYEPKMMFENDTKIYLYGNKNQQAVIVSGKNVSVWDLQKGQLMTVFSSDYRFNCHSFYNNSLLCGLKTQSKLACLYLPESKNESNAT